MRPGVACRPDRTVAGMADRPDLRAFATPRAVVEKTDESKKLQSALKDVETSLSVLGGKKAKTKK